MEMQNGFSVELREMLLHTLQRRFENNMIRHQGLEWIYVQEKLVVADEKLYVLQKMEDTGGEPDVIGIDVNTGEYIFCDCSAESPKGRRAFSIINNKFPNKKLLAKIPTSGI